eukprot:CAMPEP_0174718446 /NCGR_PEP_ID=MMETSP1094-20130205/28961_1 /TAXON_ID=156173 /ORGANISM="Chrysochromulina brevifilum, Strain UTEX LB 985" /LENGTH=145 /DNA_ID=CAMNT_0015918551 /DNA_START=347 /DNA_END=781 /DNA_ORIENTATION=+
MSSLVPSSAGSGALGAMHPEGATPEPAQLGSTAGVVTSDTPASCHWTIPSTSYTRVNPCATSTSDAILEREPVRQYTAIGQLSILEWVRFDSSPVAMEGRSRSEGDPHSTRHGAEHQSGLQTHREDDAASRLRCRVSATTPLDFP